MRHCMTAKVRLRLPERRLTYDQSVTLVSWARVLYPALRMPLFDHNAYLSDTAGWCACGADNHRHIISEDGSPRIGGCVRSSSVHSERASATKTQRRSRGEGRSVKSCLCVLKQCQQHPRVNGLLFSSGEPPSFPSILTYIQ
jgi:hypothetical protein